MAAFYAAICGLLLCTQVLAVPCPYDGCYCTQENIDCTNLGLTALPPLNTGNFTQLELDISGNQITAIGDGQLPPGLQDIYSRGNPITTISDHAFVDSARSLTNLVLNGAKFTDLPKALEDLDALSYLEITGGELTHIKASKEILPNLYFLNIRGNKISSLDGIEIFKNSLLSRIDLSKNQITTMAPLSQLDNLRTINLEGNQICDHNHIPGAVAPHADELNILNLKNNCLKKIPDLSGVASIMNLLLGNNQIDDCASGKLPETISHRLNLAYNKLTCIPSCIADPQRIDTLMLDHNQITDVSGVTFPSNTTFIGLNNNQISSVTKLNYANGLSDTDQVKLNDNPLTSVSDSAFTELTELTKLDMHNTQLTSVPTAIKDLPSLTSLNLLSSPLTCDCSLTSVATWYQSVAAQLSVSGQCGSVPVKDYLADLTSKCPSVIG